MIAYCPAFVLSDDSNMMLNTTPKCSHFYSPSVDAELIQLLRHDIVGHTPLNQDVKYIFPVAGSYINRFVQYLIGLF
jgi:hypothetical protein